MKPMTPAASSSTWASRSTSEQQRPWLALWRHGLWWVLVWLLLGHAAWVTAQEGLPATAAKRQPVNINTASAAELDALPGIGPAKARAIVAHRRKHGPFASPGDLVAVKGIGPGITARLYPLITTSDAAAAGHTPQTDQEPEP